MASETEVAGAAHAAADHAQGMPQLDFATFPNQWFWLVVTLVLLYMVMSRVVLPRIESVLTMRQGTITRDLEQAEELKQKAAEAEDAYNKALADARAEAGRIVAEAKAEIQKDVDAAGAEAEAEIAAKVAESEAQIAGIRQGALRNVEIVARDTAAEIVRAIAPALADEAAVDAAVKGQMKG